MNVPQYEMLGNKPGNVKIRNIVYKTDKSHILSGKNHTFHMNMFFILLIYHLINIFFDFPRSSSRKYTVLIVGRLRKKSCILGKSMKLGTLIKYPLLIIFRYGPKPAAPSGDRGGHYDSHFL